MNLRSRYRCDYGKPKCLKVSAWKMCRTILRFPQKENLLQNRINVHLNWILVHLIWLLCIWDLYGQNIRSVPDDMYDDTIISRCKKNRAYAANKRHIHPTWELVRRFALKSILCIIYQYLWSSMFNTQLLINTVVNPVTWYRYYSKANRLRRRSNLLANSEVS